MTRMARPRSTNKLILFLAASAGAMLAAYVFWSFAADVKALLEHRMGANPAASADTVINTIKLVFTGIIGYIFVRALNWLFFSLAFRLKRIDAAALVRIFFAIVVFVMVFLLGFAAVFPAVKLG